MTTDDIMNYKPQWYAARNGVNQFSENGYYCDGGYLSISVEKRTRNNNRTRILTYVNSLIGKQGIVSSKEVANALDMTEEFVLEILEEEFGELDEKE